MQADSMASIAASAAVTGARPPFHARQDGRGENEGVAIRKRQAGFRRPWETDAPEAQPSNSRVSSRLGGCFGFPASLVVVEVDDGLDLEFVINQAHMAADRDVAVVAWGRRQAARQIGRYRVHLPSQTLVQYRALMQARFLVGRQSILVPEPYRRMGLVLLVPIARHLLVVLVKLGMTLLVLIASLSPVLCKSGAAGQGQNRGRSRSQQPMCFHKYPLYMKTTFIVRSFREKRSRPPTPDGLDWAKSLPFSYDRLDAAAVIRLILQFAGRGRQGPGLIPRLKSRYSFPARLAHEGGTEF